MCLYIAWWFSGDYPALLHNFDIPIFFFWALVCIGTTANWEIMLQQNFEANERSTGKFSKVSKDEMNKKVRLGCYTRVTCVSRGRDEQEGEAGLLHTRYVRFAGTR